MTRKLNLFLYSVIFIILFLITFAMTGCDSTVTPDDGSLPRDLSKSERDILNSSEKFGLKIFQELAMAERQTNIFISPLSISLALSMTLNGANSSTYDAMINTLECNGLSLSEINQANKDLMQLLTNLDGKVTFNIANSIWYRNTMTFREDFLQRNRDYYDARVTGIDFTEPASVGIINNWIADKTNHKITEVLDSIDPSSVMFLINALYFYGDWTTKFDATATHEDTFYHLDGHPSNCQMMFREGEMEYFKNEKFEMVDLPYGSEHFSMSILLPTVGNNITDVITSITNDEWDSTLSNLRKTDMQLKLPRFSFEYKRKLKDILTYLGMGVAFTDNADFTNMREEGGLAINDVIHKSFIKVNEDGSEAAAVTVVDIVVTSMPDPKPIMIVNRPFMFVIREKETGTILFAGQVLNPTI